MTWTVVLCFQNLMNMKQILTFLLLTTLCGATYSQTGSLLFRSGFEPTTDTTLQGPSGADIHGVDNSFASDNDWQSDLEGAPNNCSFTLQYQGGDDTMRLAEIAKDPLNPLNNVLHFWIDYPNVPVDSVTRKGRVQGNLYNCSTGFDNLFYSIRLFLPSDLDTLKYVPKDIKWFTLMEFWNNSNWIDPANGFRVSLNLQMIDGGNGTTPDPLRFGVHGQIYDTVSTEFDSTIWEITNMSFAIPTNKWMTIKINYIEGNNTTGKFYMTIQPDGDPETVLFNLNNWTHHPGDSTPDGLTHHNPVKMYTSGALIDSLRNWGKLTHVYWDDYMVWSDSIVPTSITPRSHPTALRIYPNPTNGTAHVDIGSIADDGPTLNVYDVLGRNVLSSTGISSREILIDLSGFPMGLYYAEVISDDKIMGYGKIIKR